VRKSNKLTPQKVRITNGLGRYADGGGLYLQVSRVAERATKAWIFRYMLDGRARHMGIGSIDDFTLAEARERARKARQQVKDGIDPIDVRRAERDARKVAAAQRVTFRQCAERYIAAHEKSWKNEKHRGQWKKTLEAYAYPLIGDLPVADIGRAHIQKIIEPLWQEKTETANRLRGRIEAVLDWATAREYRTGENPARWKGHLQKLLPARNKVSPVEHHEAMSCDDMPSFMANLRGADSLSSRALEFTILTAARTGEAINARWGEVDFKNKVWTIPGERMKAGKEHRVPLSDRAVEILKSLPRLGDFLFPGRKGAPLSHTVMLELLRGMVGNGVTVHGFRSTFKDWARERTGFTDDISEAALAHKIKDKTNAAYARGDLFEKRRKLMAAWAGYCTSPPPSSDRVVPISQVRA